MGGDIELNSAVLVDVACVLHAYKNLYLHFRAEARLRGVAALTFST
jgi:hypothetical protein